MKLWFLHLCTNFTSTYCVYWAFSVIVKSSRTSIYSSTCRCGRVTVHTHLCVSLLASNLAWLVWHYAVLGQHEVWSTNSVWCRAVNTATTFLTMTNYAWMLAEVTYLHNIYTISTHNIYTYLHRAPSSTSCWCSPSCRRPAWCGCCGCWAGSHPASASSPTLSTAPTTRSHHCLQLHTIY